MLVLILFLAISFGVVGFTLMDHSNMETCPISSMSGNICTLVSDNVIFAFHHIQAFQQLTQTSILYGVIALILILLAGVFITQKLLNTYTAKVSSSFAYILKERTNLPFLPPYIFKWFALHNKRSIDSNIFVGGL